MQSSGRVMGHQLSESLPGVLLEYSFLFLLLSPVFQLLRGAPLKRALQSLPPTPPPALTFSSVTKPLTGVDAFSSLPWCLVADAVP